LTNLTTLDQSYNFILRRYTKGALIIVRRTANRRRGIGWEAQVVGCGYYDKKADVSGDAEYQYVLRFPNGFVF
jgi:hypothetical protein